ncbi:MAG: hypothetical protein ACKVT2_15520 [Saprospiraceae bacterium]
MKKKFFFNEDDRTNHFFEAVEKLTKQDLLKLTGGTYLKASDPPFLKAEPPYAESTYVRG